VAAAAARANIASAEEDGTSSERLVSSTTSNKRDSERFREEAARVSREGTAAEPVSAANMSWCTARMILRARRGLA
jgi:hypothetical protein